MGSYFFLVVFVFAIIGTAWGWTRILIPFGFPAVFGLWRIFQTILISIVLIVPLNTGWWFRTYGYDLTDIVWRPVASQDQWDRFKRHREESINLQGNWEPNWREHRKLPPLGEDWDGHSEHSTHPLFSLLVYGGLWIGYLAFERAYQRKHGKKGTDNRPTRETPDVEDLRQKLDALHDKYAGRNEFEQLIQRYETKRVRNTPVTVDTDDSNFIQALRNLGYKDREIQGVASQCTEQDLEARVRHALKILARA